MENHPYPEDYTKASENLRLALSLLSKHRIPPSPVNYHIAYECITGRDEELKNNLDQLLEESGTPTAKSMLDLYRRFIHQDEEALDTIRQEIGTIISRIQRDFHTAGGNIHSYIHKLNQFSRILNKPLSAEQMSSEAQKVLTDTQEVENSQNQLESQIGDLLTEMDSMRRELEQVREESKTDGLTGLSNRKAFDTALEHAIHNAREQQTSLCVIIADIDHFKKFNDNYGHLVGDKVLRFVASTLKRCTKGKDFAARFGGEEFAVILPQTEMKGAQVVAEQIREAISSGNLKDNQTGDSYGTITMSIGAAQYIPNDLPNRLIQRADSALYLAKQRGRNRVDQAV